MANTDRVTQMFLDLVRINSPSKQERPVADYVKAKLSSLGFDVKEDDAGSRIGGNAGNVIASLKGTAPGAKEIFLSCHMDTVEPTENINVVIKDGVLQSDGNTILGADDKAGIAAVIEGIESILEKNNPRGDIQVLFSISEEVGLLGARHIDTEILRGKLGYVLDTQKPVGGVTISAPSHVNMTVEIFGKASHAGIAPELGVSAIVAASRAITRMKLGRIDEETSANVGRIEGGKARNIVPDYVKITAEARSRNDDKLNAQVEHMTKTFEEEAAAIGAKAVVDAKKEYVTFRFSAEDEVVKLAVAAGEKLGIEPELAGGGGGSDANIFNVAGIPTVVIGVGYDGAHSHTENIAANDLVKAADWVSSLIEVAAQIRG